MLIINKNVIILFVARLLEKGGDSAKPLSHIGSIYKLLLSNYGVDADSLNYRKARLTAIKKLLSHPVGFLFLREQSE